MSEESILPQNNSPSNRTSKKFNLEEFFKSLPVGYKDAYSDVNEIENYHAPGSYFEGLNIKEVLEKITEKALELDLEQEHIQELMENSDIWRYLSDKQKSALQRKYQNNLNQRSSEISVEKIFRLSQGLKAYAEYFSGEQPL